MIDEVKNVLANLWDLKADEIPDDCKLGQFHKWDSLSHIQIMLELENSLDLELNADNIQALNSLEKIVSELIKRAYSYRLNSSNKKIKKWVNLYLNGIKHTL